MQGSEKLLLMATQISLLLAHTMIELVSREIPLLQVSSVIYDVVSRILMEGINAAAKLGGDLASKIAAFVLSLLGIPGIPLPQEPEGGSDEQNG